MSDRMWRRAFAAKLAVGVILALIAGAVGDIATRRWPTGGAS